MKTLTKLALVLIPTITLSMTATAHDPKLHAKKAEKADCSKMDNRKIEMKDPVAIAMMKKCMKQAEKSKGKLKDKEIKMEKKEIKMKDKEMKSNVIKGSTLISSIAIISRHYFKI
ncbi:hypothetical protein H4J62_19325 [Colwellia sp. BRX8-5]|uniref:hypothetical protein n=1 Tax=Colwellia sp. BRX8-5 TaxID=2759835 RepID=UPI0015F3724F|nr:hypothetical protein [Colwellia sp. BRX8-5]MBA6369652.1 hypothetical protein [Colwellia sp. BRX8-5]